MSSSVYMWFTIVRLGAAILIFMAISAGICSFLDYREWVKIEKRKKEARDKNPKAT